MELRQRKLPDKINEQYILPILFLLVNVTVVIWFYVIHEYSQSNEVFETAYRYNKLTIANYRSDLKFQFGVFSGILLITPLYLKYKKRWLLVTIALMHAGALYYFFYLK